MVEKKWITGVISPLLVRLRIPFITVSQGSSNGVSFWVDAKNDAQFYGNFEGFPL